MSIVPVSKTEARRFVNDHHRHNEAPSEMQVSLAVGLDVDGVMVGVGTAGRPVARALDDGFTLEVNRTCTLGEKNANSMIYGALARAGAALGYRLLITYTLQSESGASLKAAGFKPVAELAARGSWAESSKSRPTMDTNLFGERKQAQHQPKIRWERTL